MPQDSRMKITGKNALIALLIAFAVTSVLAFLYSCMALFGNFNTREDGSISAAINDWVYSFAAFFKIVEMCAAPIVTLLSFALLQRFRIKDNLDADGAEEDES